MPSLQEARSVIDFGLLVLIWIVQLIVYPGFKYTAVEHFAAWHSQYSMLISFVVVPLMLSQVGIVGMQLINTPHWAVGVSALLVGLVWVSTFFQAVPIHNTLQAATQLSPDELQHHASRLVSVNWVRTILWTCLFGLGLVRP